MKAPFVTLSPQELWSLSPEVRQRVRDSVTAKRVSTDSQKDTLLNVEEPLPFSDDAIPYDDIPNSTQPPPGSIVIEDPYEVYLSSLRPGDPREILTVAKESLALRSIHMFIDHQNEVEAIIDPGSQIIAMSEDVCHQLSLLYDPTIRVNMQSANGEIDQSLGLARNVPCSIGDITLYLQIHVIRNPTYNVLLGRPFDVLTESIVKNFANEDQTLTLRDPNSGRRLTVPTLPRGPPRRRTTPQTSGFRNSMI